MSFQLMNPMEKRPWETLHSLEANLFGLCYVESSWEDLRAIKAGKGPTLPRLALPCTAEGRLKKISSFALESDTISLNQQSKQRPC